MNALLLSTVALVPLIAIGGLAVDLCNGFQTVRRLQAAADAGALAAAFELYRGNDLNVASSSATESVFANGISNGVNGAEVTVLPPASAPYFNRSKFVQVSISQRVSTSFGTLLGQPVVTPSVKAVAGVIPIPNCPTPIGGDDHTLQVICGADGTDPLQNIQAPVVPAGAAQPPCTSGTCNPGLYCHGIQLTDNTVLNPGIYFISGGFTAPSSVSNLTAIGVTLYMGTSYPGCPSGPGNPPHYAGFDLEARNMDLSAPMSGPTAGVLFFADRNTVCGSDECNNTIGGNRTTTTLTGSVYLLGQTLTVAGRRWTMDGAIVADEVDREFRVRLNLTNTGGNIGTTQVVLAQ